MKKFDTKDVEAFLELVVGNPQDDTLCDLDIEDIEVQTFKRAGVLTRDNGLVLHLNGREFQLSIVRSK